MRSQDQLILTKTFDERAGDSDKRGHVDEGVPFGDILFAQHGNVVDHVVLNHEEGIIFQGKKIEFLDNFQGSKRVDSWLFAFPGKQILDDSNRLNIFVGTILRVDDSVDDL